MNNRKFVPAGFPTGLDEEHIYRLGEVAVLAARLEFEAAVIVWDLIDDDRDIGMSVTAGMSFQAVNKLISQLIAKRFPSNDALFRQSQNVTKEGEAVMNLRNRLLHGYWEESSLDSPHPTLSTRARANANRPASVLEDSMTVDEIQEVAARIDSADGSYHFLHLELLVQLQRFPGVSGVFRSEA